MTLEDRLRARWKLLFVVLVVTSAGNVAAMPNWMPMQFAGDAARFRDLVDSPARTTLAAIFDIGVAASYGILGWIGLRRHGGGTRLSRVAAWVVVVGATCDQAENLLVLRNVIALDTLTDGWVAAMRAPGYISWIAAPAILLLYAYLIRFWLQRRHSVAATAN